jgi:predicted PP-loop superfamily ATPase
MKEMELLDATSAVGLLKDRFDAMEQCHNSRSYRCVLHMRAMLRRPKTVRFQWQGILRELSGVEVRRFGPAYSLQSSG